MVRVLLDRGATASSEDKLGRTPLHMVSTGASVSQEDGVYIARLLLEYGADVNAQDKNQETPLDLASRHEKLEIASLLRWYGPDGGKAKGKINQGSTANQLELKGVNIHDKPEPSI